MTDFEIAKVGSRGLASAIILQAVLDYNALRPSDTEKKQELNEFFSSEWFNKLCEICNLVPKTIRRKLETSSFKIPDNNLRSQRR